MEFWRPVWLFVKDEAASRSPKAILDKQPNGRNHSTMKINGLSWREGASFAIFYVSPKDFSANESDRL